MHRPEWPSASKGSLIYAFPFPNLRTQPTYRVIFHIDYALLHWDDRVISDLDVLRADLGTTLGDVAHSKTMLFLRLLLSVTESIQWMHIKFRYSNKESWTSKRLLVLFMVANNMAGVLAEETLDALSEFLAPFDIHLLHSILARL